MQALAWYCVVVLTLTQWYPVELVQDCLERQKRFLEPPPTLWPPSTPSPLTPLAQIVLHLCAALAAQCISFHLRVPPSSYPPPSPHPCLAYLSAQLLLALSPLCEVSRPSSSRPTTLTLSPVPKPYLALCPTPFTTPTLPLCSGLFVSALFWQKQLLHGNSTSKAESDNPPPRALSYSVLCALHSLHVAQHNGSFVLQVRHVGVSNETSYGVMRFIQLAEQSNLPRIVSIQNCYNLLARGPFDTNLTEVCAPRQCNVGLLAYSPLAGGALSGKYVQGGDKLPKARFNLFPGKQRFNMFPGKHSFNMFPGKQRWTPQQPSPALLVLITPALAPALCPGLAAAVHSFLLVPL